MLAQAVIVLLDRYIQAFDTDRSALQHAYANNALFSYRITLSSSSISQPSNRLSQGPSQIATSLSSILGPYKFCPDGTTGEVHYDVVSLHRNAGGGILLTVHGLISRSDNATVFEANRAHVLAIDQSFILQRNILGDEGNLDRVGTEWNGTHSSWSLVAVAHQMVVRDIGSEDGKIGSPSAMCLEKD